MFIIDRASSYTDKKFAKVCYSKNILPFQRSSYRTYILQSFDFECFQALNNNHFERIDNAVRDGNYQFSKLEFLA